MKRMAILCVVFGILITQPLHAKGKKGTEPTICKRGKLIFEDDFSGKELNWVPDQRSDWRIIKKTLATGSVCPDGTNCMELKRVFTEAGNVIAEFRVCVPAVDRYTFEVARKGRNYVFLRIAPDRQVVNIVCKTGAEFTDIASMPFPYRKPRWCNVMIETMGARIAATVDGRTIDVEDVRIAEFEKKCFTIGSCRKEPGKDLLLIDDVKVYEALPPDADEKGKK